MTPPQSRAVTGGRMEGTDEAPIYVVQLDGREDVETLDWDTASTLGAAKRAHKAVAIELQDRGKGLRPRIVKVEVLETAPATRTSPEPTTSTTSAARPAETARPVQLAKVPAIPQHAIQRAQDLTSHLQAMAQHYNIISPAIAISDIAPGFVANLASVLIDSTIVDASTGRGTETYRSAKLHQPHERALGKIAIVKISQAIGIKWVAEQCMPIPTGERNLWRWKHFGYYLAHDGQPQPVMGSKELDLRDGSAEIAGMKPPQIQQQRSFGNEICETKSMERAVRSLGIRQIYTVDELQKPFLIPRFSFAPDMNDPEIKKLVTEHALRGMGALYPAAAVTVPALPPPGDEIDEAMPTVAGGATQTYDSKQTSERKPDPFADADAAPATEALTIADVVPAKGKNARTGRSWTRYDVTLSTGEIVSTFSETLQQLIDDAWKQKAPVRIETEPNEGYNDKLTKLTIVDGRQPSLPGTEPTGGY